MRIRLPTLTVINRKLRKLETNNKVAVCMPLITLLIKPFQHRFGDVFWCTNKELISALYPHFCLSWLSWRDNDDDDELAVK